MASRTPPKAGTGKAAKGSLKAGRPGGPSGRTGSGSAARRRTPPPKSRRNIPWGVVGASVLVLVFVVGVITYAAVNAGEESTTAQASRIDGVETFDKTAAVNEHTTEPVTYEENPPVGGPHNPAWQNCGVYTEPIQNENAVHSLEHGAVWITYRPDLPEDQVEQLRGLVEGNGYRLLSPYPDLSAPVVASAWGRQLKVDSADDERLGQFVGAYTQNPETTPEPGAACTGGVGEPAG